MICSESEILFLLLKFSLPNIKTEDSLVSFYKRNKKAVDMLKSMNDSCYEELLEEFKKRKNEINNWENQNYKLPK